MLAVPRLCTGARGRHRVRFAAALNETEGGSPILMLSNVLHNDATTCTFNRLFVSCRVGVGALAGPGILLSPFRTLVSLSQASAVHRTAGGPGKNRRVRVRPERRGHPRQCELAPTTQMRPTSRGRAHRSQVTRRECSRARPRGNRCSFVSCTASAHSPRIPYSPLRAARLRTHNCRR